MTDPTPSTAVAVRQPTQAVALTDEHYLNRIPVIAQQLARSNMCPDTFKGKPDDIAIIGYGLADNGISLSISTLPMCYVVHGRPGYMAQLQQAMADMHGVTIRPLDYDEQHATVEVILRDGAVRQVSFTMSEARKAGLVASNKMYEKWPANMLMARATTRAIGWYCPGAKLGLARSADMEEVERADAVGLETGELVAATQAKRKLLDILLQRVIPAGPDEAARLTQAKGMAAVLWSSHRLPSGDASLPLSDFDRLVDSLPSAPAVPDSPPPAPDDDAIDAEVVTEHPPIAPEGFDRVADAFDEVQEQQDEATSAWQLNDQGQWVDANGNVYSPAAGEEQF